MSAFGKKYLLLAADFSQLCLTNNLLQTNLIHYLAKSYLIRN